MTKQFKLGDHDSIARQSTTQLAEQLRLRRHQAAALAKNDYGDMAAEW